MLDITFPIIQAPMAGGIISPAFVAAVSNYGCLGSLAAGGLSLDTLARQIEEVRFRAARPYAVNIFAHQRTPEVPDNITAVNDALNDIRRILNIPEVTDIQFSSEPSIEDYAAFCIKMNVPVVSFTFGCPDKQLILQLKDAGIQVIGTATNVKEALIIEEHGMDYVTVQGYEAGGHQGGFLKQPSIGLISLIPQAADAVSIPVIAAGGIADRRGIAAAKMLGADYVQIGTRFLNTYESSAHPLHKEAINNADETAAVVTTAITGKSARGIRNKLMQQPAVPYPLMNQMTADIRAAAKVQNNSEYMSNWSGQNIRSAETIALHVLLDELTNTEQPDFQ
ncbi:NAD(P)H-dependent flavin oxidoreductase [Macrococcus equipercicus]|uniref:Probable nitronate monooxygenase n=1 Tax=Macrococcus equipercicus TaxID=69967 RepID=A0A9Q9BUS4_9STAP|nr:nitronate monooxygenase [Macrococcus equipercicus]UTH13457.1 nitronate monooxygenase [Macrococcus equipercicus]